MEECDNSLDGICGNAVELPDYVFNRPSLYQCGLNLGICPDPKDKYCFSKRLLDEVIGEHNDFKYRIG